MTFENTMLETQKTSQEALAHLMDQTNEIEEKQYDLEKVVKEICDKTDAILKQIEDIKSLLNV